MTGTIIAPDASGTLADAAAGFATARSWALFGEIYRNDGVAPNSVRVLPPVWVANSAEPNAASAARRYGAHIWVKKAAAGHLSGRSRPGLPEDTKLMNGQLGQFAAVVPSHGITIVRLGDSPG